eukprot:6206916-Pleurochrysis_carterae.AAC.2
MDAAYRPTANAQRTPATNHSGSAQGMSSPSLVPSMGFQSMNSSSTMPSMITVPCPVSKQNKRLLWALNLLFGFLHFVLCIIVASLAHGGHMVALYRTKLTPVVETIGNQRFETYRLTPATPIIVCHLHLSAAISSIFAITSCAHFGNALLWRTLYERSLEQCSCPFRWIEYGVSASIMMLVIGALSGQVMLVPLLLLFGLSLITMEFGAALELVNRPLNSKSWQEPATWKRLIVFVFGCTPQVFVWAAIFLEFSWHAYDNDSADAIAKAQIPGFVYAIVLGESLLFLCFAVVALRVLLNPPSEYIRGEVMYQTLSFAAKIFLGVSTVFGALVADSVGELYVDSAYLSEQSSG